MDCFQVIIHPPKEFQPRDLNIVVLKRFFSTLPQGVEFIRRKPNGDIGVYVSPASHLLLDHLRKVTDINGVQVKIEVPSSATTIKGVISHPEIRLTTDLELQELFADRQVLSIKKIAQDTAVIEWSADTIPEGLPAYVVLGWDTVKVRKYYKRPTRCYFCQHYGHVASSCKKKQPVCCRCAATGHTREDCTAATPKCAACQESHETTDPNCNKWKEEKIIAKIRQDQRLTYKDAVLKVKQQQQRPDQDQEKKKQEIPTPQQEEEEQEENKEEEEDIIQESSTTEDNENEDSMNSEEVEDDEPSTEEIQEVIQEHLVNTSFTQVDTTIETIATKQRKIIRRKVLHYTGYNKLEEKDYFMIQNIVDIHLYELHFGRKLTSAEQRKIARCNHQNCSHIKLRKEIFKQPTPDSTSLL